MPGGPCCPRRPPVGLGVVSAAPAGLRPHRARPGCWHSLLLAAQPLCPMAGRRRGRRCIASFRHVVAPGFRSSARIRLRDRSRSTQGGRDEWTGHFYSHGADFDTLLAAAAPRGFATRVRSFSGSSCPKHGRIITRHSKMTMTMTMATTTTQVMCFETTLGELIIIGLRGWRARAMNTACRHGDFGDAHHGAHTSAAVCLLAPASSSRLLFTAAFRPQWSFHGNILARFRSSHGETARTEMIRSAHTCRSWTAEPPPSRHSQDSHHTAGSGLPI